MGWQRPTLLVPPTRPHFLSTSPLNKPLLVNLDSLVGLFLGSLAPFPWSSFCVHLPLWVREGGRSLGPVRAWEQVYLGPCLRRPLSRFPFLLRWWELFSPLHTAHPSVPTTALASRGSSGRNTPKWAWHILASRQLCLGWEGGQ